MRPAPSSSSVHSKFFQSLKQVEKRLKLENPETRQPLNLTAPPSKHNNIEETTEFSLSTPIYLHSDTDTGIKPNNTSTTATSLQESSEPPLAFLSPSHSSLQIHQQQQQQQPNCIHHPVLDDGVDDIELLMQHLGLSHMDQQSNQQLIVDKEEGEDNKCCGCEGGFYDKIVGVKGPKCQKEEDRLTGWIKYFCKHNGCGEERMEPLRLAFLLLGKAACEFETDDVGLEFPSTIHDFLKYDPPTE